MQLASEMLKIEAAAGKKEALAYYGSHNIDSLIAESLPTLSDKTLIMALKILSILSINPDISKKLCSKMMPFPQKIMEIIEQAEVCKNTLDILLEFSADRANK